MWERLGRTSDSSSGIVAVAVAVAVAAVTMILKMTVVKIIYNINTQGAAFSQAFRPATAPNTADKICKTA